MVHVDPQWLTVVVGSLIPILTGFATKLHAPDGVKASVAIFFSALTGIVIQISSNGGNFEWAASGKLFAIAFVTQLASYLGVLKPVGNTPYVPGQLLFKNFGIGGSTESVQNAGVSTTPPRYDALINEINTNEQPATPAAAPVGVAIYTG